MNKELDLLIEQLKKMKQHQCGGTRLASMKQARFFIWKLKTAAKNHPHAVVEGDNSWTFYLTNEPALTSQDWITIIVDTSDYSYPRMRSLSAGLGKKLVLKGELVEKHFPGRKNNYGA